LKKGLINKAILEELFNTYYNSLYYHAYSFLNDSEISKDIVNDVFEYIWENRNTIDISYSLKSLLYSMVKNKAINHIRHQEVKKKHFNFEISKSEIAEDDYQEHDTLIEKLMQAIEELPPKAGLVFKMCFIENLSYKEIAAELGVSVNTVKTHITKSLKRLREDFNQELLLFFFCSENN